MVKGACGRKDKLFTKLALVSENVHVCARRKSCSLLFVTSKPDRYQIFWDRYQNWWFKNPVYQVFFPFRCTKHKYLVIYFWILTKIVWQCCPKIILFYYHKSWIARLCSVRLLGSAGCCFVAFQTHALWWINYATSTHKLVERCFS